MNLVTFIKNLITKKKSLKRKSLKRKPHKQHFCRKNCLIKCRYYKRVKVKSNKEIILKDSTKNQKKIISQSEPRNGCSHSREIHTDYVTGIKTRILQNCDDLNNNGQCRKYRFKWWIV
jgi:hypothetical protein